MKYPVFSVRDKASGAYMAPTVDTTEQTAIRNFSRAVNSGGLDFQSEDFDLYKVGYFDDQSGELEHILPEYIVNGLNVKKVTSGEM